MARAEPLPILAAFGEFPPAGLTQLARLATQLRFVLDSSRYVEWPAVEEAVILLAERLSGRYTARELVRMRFVGIPRGGLVVLGLLLYALGLPAASLSEEADPKETLVVVDDCALTGLRFRHFLSRRDARRVIFCPLFSHPDLRTAIETAEPRVDACISAHDLADHARAIYGTRYATWRAGAAGPGSDGAYWVGRPEQLGFPWSEPQSGFRDPVTGITEEGWELFPPRLCLKHRVLPAGPPLQLADPGPGPIRPADRVVWARLGNAVAVAAMPGETAGHASPSPLTECLRLAGSAADMWDAVIQTGNLESAEPRLRQMYDVPPDVLRRDLIDLVGGLQNDGILTGG